MKLSNKQKRTFQPVTASIYAGEDGMMDLMKQVKAEKKIAKAYNLKSIEEWCNQAIYMIDTYTGTSHEAEVRADIERMLKKLK